MKSAIVATLVLTVLFNTALRAEEKKADAAPQKTPEALQKSIDSGIELLEKEKYEEALKLLAPPQLVKAVSDDPKEMQKVVDGFKADKAAPLLAALKFIKDKQPILSEENKKATFSLQGANVPGKEEIAFTFDERWYLR